ncbi:MAG: MFS transporter, partial [Hyphomicrobiaceae bacterium]|nr:MFS transporter [Hyphomicrobiaceae bacterium]
PSMHWADPIVAEDLSPGGGPVMIQVAYDVGPAEQARFVALMRECAAMRRRGGGYRWSLMQDSADASRFVETWMESSWLQHLRHHDRVTGADRDLQVRIHSLLSAGTKPVVTHYVSPSEA